MTGLINSYPSTKKIFVKLYDPKWCVKIPQIYTLVVVLQGWIHRSEVINHYNWKRKIQHILIRLKVIDKQNRIIQLTEIEHNLNIIKTVNWTITIKEIITTTKENNKF